MGGWTTNTDEILQRGCLAPHGETPLGDLLQMCNSTVATAAGVWTANRAVYQPFLVKRQVIVTDTAVFVVTQAGNLDVGIYDLAGTRIVSSGTTACGAAGVQVVGITDTTLSPGWYYVGFASDSSTAVFQNCALDPATMRMCGAQEQATAFVLPNPATFATYATARAPQIVLSYSATF